MSPFLLTLARNANDKHQTEQSVHSFRFGTKKKFISFIF